MQIVGREKEIKELIRLKEPEHHATPIRITWKNCDLKACEWNTGNTNPMEITTDIICEFCNEQ
jgi:hypothetical protein